MVYPPTKKELYCGTTLKHLMFFLQKHRAPCRTQTHLSWFRSSGTISIPMGHSIFNNIDLKLKQFNTDTTKILAALAGLEPTCYFLTGNCYNLEVTTNLTIIAEENDCSKYSLI